jgi:hypothetical protein
MIRGLRLLTPQGDRSALRRLRGFVGPAQAGLRSNRGTLPAARCRFDLLVKSLLALGVSKKELARTIS